MAHARRETDPIMHSSRQQQLPQSNGELKVAARELMQVVAASKAEWAATDAAIRGNMAQPDLSPKPTLLQLSLRSRARNEQLSLQQLVTDTLSENRWRRNNYASTYRRHQERLNAAATSASSRPPPPPQPQSPGNAEPEQAVWTPRRPSNSDHVTSRTPSFSSEVSGVDDDSETTMLTGKTSHWRQGVDGPFEDEEETEDEMGRTTDPRAKLISSV